MAKKKKTRPFRAVTAVKSAAREHIGSPPPARIVPDTKKDRQAQPKHKPTLSDLLREWKE